MQRLLLILRGPIDLEVVRERCASGRSGVAEPYEMAICHVLQEGEDGLYDGLRAQQRITAALREVLGQRAETVAVLVASSRDGCGVDDCVRDWGATIVCP